MSIRIGCVVEGHGDARAVPIVVRRIATAVDPTVVVDVPSTIRIPKSKLVRPGELERAVELAARRVGRPGAVLIVLDSDDDCPAKLGPSLHRRAIEARSDLHLAVVLAKPEFESWFLAAAESLRGHRGLSLDLDPPLDPEAVRGAKEWLRDRMDSRVYSETLDQPKLAARFDFDLARRADSFDKCYREVVRLVTDLVRAGARS